MPNPTLNRDRAAKILLDASLVGDRPTAEKWEISERTIRNYHHKLSTDPDFSAFFQLKKAEQDRAWTNEIPGAIASCIQFIRKSAQSLKPDDPEAVHAIAGAMKILSEIAMTREVIEARLSAQELN